MGRVKTLLGDYDEAIRLQKIYLNICTTEEPVDQVGEAAARAALADAYEALGAVADAIQQLEILLTVAGECGEVRAQAQACLNLGVLYGEAQSTGVSEIGGAEAYNKSIQLLEKHFDLARQLGDRELIDAARVILGMARGNGKLDLYMNVVRNDMVKLLDWKARRVNLRTTGSLRN